MQEQLLSEHQSIPADIIEAEALPEPENALAITPERLQYLLTDYTIEAIGQVFGVTGTAIRKRMKKFNLSRPAKRIVSGVLSSEQITAAQSKIKQI